MKQRLTRTEIGVVAFLLFCAVAWMLLPVIPQPQSYHDFADQRALAGIPNAADVLSNIAFAVAGILGFLRLGRRGLALSGTAEACLHVFFAGLLITAFGSSYYHWNPTNATLVWDRLSIMIAFSGMLGTLAAQRISSRAAFLTLVITLVVGPFSVFYWQRTGDLALYGVVQFGGMLGTLLVLLFTRRGTDPFPWWALLACYVVAKLAEAADQIIWDATQQMLGGHALKHLAAGVGGIIFANALRRRYPEGPSFSVRTRSPA